MASDVEMAAHAHPGELQLLRELGDRDARALAQQQEQLAPRVHPARVTGHAPSRHDRRATGRLPRVSRLERLINLTAALLAHRSTADGGRAARTRSRLCRAIAHVPARVRARQGDPARHGRADLDGAARPRRSQSARLPDPARRVLPRPTPSSSPTSSRHCISRRRQCDWRAPAASRRCGSSVARWPRAGPSPSWPRCPAPRTSSRCSGPSPMRQIGDVHVPRRDASQVDPYRLSFRNGHWYLAGVRPHARRGALVSESIASRAMCTRVGRAGRL